MFCEKSQREALIRKSTLHEKVDLHRILSVQKWYKKVQTTVKSGAKMVNTTIALEFTTPCKLGCKCGIYNFCLWFPPSLHFVQPVLPIDGDHNKPGCFSTFFLASYIFMSSFHEKDFCSGSEESSVKLWSVDLYNLKFSFWKPDWLSTSN